MARTKEGQFQDDLIEELQTDLNFIVLKNDPNYIQGFPDLTVITDIGITVFLEVKKSSNAPYQTNQEYYLDLLHTMGYYTTTIYPENKEEVLYEIQQALRNFR